MQPTNRRSAPLPHDARTIVLVEDRVAAPEAHTTVDVMHATPAPAGLARGSAPGMKNPNIIERARMLKHTPPPSIGSIPSIVTTIDEAKTRVHFSDARPTTIVEAQQAPVDASFADIERPTTIARSLNGRASAPAPVAAPVAPIHNGGDGATMAAMPWNVAMPGVARGSVPTPATSDAPVARRSSPAPTPEQLAKRASNAPVQAMPAAPVSRTANPDVVAADAVADAADAKAAVARAKANAGKPAQAAQAAKPAQAKPAQAAGAKPVAGAKPAQAAGAKPAVQVGAKPAAAQAAKPAAAAQVAGAKPAAVAAKPAQAAAPGAKVSKPKMQGAAPAAAAPKAAAPAQAAAAPKAVAPVAAKPVEPPVPTAAIPVGAPIEVPDTVYALIRRIALQSDLTNVAGVLQTGLGELVGARVVMALVNERNEISSPMPKELRDAFQVVRLDAIQQCVQRRQVLASERCILVPFASTTPAVLIVWRAATQPVLEHSAIMLAVATATRLGVIDHFFSKHAEAQRQSAQDAKSMFRPEALVASRSKNREGAVVDLSPKWVKIALPTVILLAIALVVGAALVQVPTYSTGTIVVTMNGRNVIANASGRIADVYVAPGQHVKAGQPLMTLDTTNEKTGFDQIDTVYRDQLAAFLVDTTDENARHSLAGILAQRKTALDAFAQKTITAPVDGVVGAILANDIVNGGEHVLTIIPEGNEPSITAFMPGTDRSRIKPGMTLQIQMTGYSSTREHLVITEVGEEIIGPAQARKQLGQKLADAVALPQTIVVIKAKLVGSTFEARGKTYEYFDGMDGIGEIEVDTKSFLATVIPTGD